MPRLKNRLRAKRAEPSDTGPCPRCAAPIRVGDELRQIDIEGSKRRPYAHIDCRGRIELHLGLNVRAYAPTPREFTTPQECPMCRRYMVKTQSRRWYCGYAENHPDGKPLYIAMEATDGQPPATPSQE